MNFLAQLIKPTNIPQTPATQATLDKVLSLIFVTIGAIAVLMLVIGGVRYIFAGGKPEDVTKARNMIVYSLIGLVIAALAAAIVNVIAALLK